MAHLNYKKIVLEKWKAAGTLTSRSPMEDFLDVFPTPETLLKFYDEIRILSFPDTYGESPWDFASSMGYYATYPPKERSRYLEPTVMASDRYAVALSRHWGADLPNLAAWAARIKP